MATHREVFTRARAAVMAKITAHEAAAIAPVAASSFAPGTPGDAAAARLLALKGADRVALEQAARHTAGNPETSRALGLLGRVALL